MAAVRRLGKRDSKKAGKVEVLAYVSDDHLCIGCGICAMEQVV